MPPINRILLSGSEDSYDPSASETYAQDLAMSLQFMDLLEPTNETNTSITPLQGHDLELHRLLSIHSFVITSSSNAARQSLAQATNSRRFSKIGAGACGAIFAQEGKSLVFKLAKTSDLCLWK